MDELATHLGITPWGAMAVVISSVCMYAEFSLVLHLWGERLRTSSSTVRWR